MADVLINKRSVVLSCGHVAFVDEEDFDRVNEFSWHSVLIGGNHYARRYVNGEQKNQYLHHFVMGVADGRIVDHKNGDGMDNRKENLRFATHSQNMRNQRTPKNNRSGVKGVHFDRQTGKWRASLSVDRKFVCLGRHETIEEAESAVRVGRQQHHGEFARD